MQPTTVVAYWPKPARPTRGSTVFFLLPGGEAAACPMAGEPRWLLPACVPPSTAWSPPRTPRDPLVLSPLSLDLFPLLWLPLPLFPSAPEGAAVLYHGHRPPHASPTRQEAPPRSPLPPHQGGGRRKPCDAANIIFFLAGRRRSSLPPRLLGPSPSLLTSPSDSP